MINILQLGRTGYAEALDLQRVLVERRKSRAIEDVLLLLEHPPTITLGRNAQQKHIVASPELLAAKGIEIFECNRGGDVTYHGPGQLVGYPIFDLRAFTDENGGRRTLWPVEFVRMVEEVLIGACRELNVACTRVAGLTGVWTELQTTANPKKDKLEKNEPAKIAAIGVHISRGITSHGFALNVNTALDAFQLIVPCGISDKPVTSLQKELQKRGSLAPGAELNINDVCAVVSRNFVRVFNQEAQDKASLEELIGPSPQDSPLKVPRELQQIRRERPASLA